MAIKKIRRSCIRSTLDRELSMITEEFGSERMRRRLKAELKRREPLSHSDIVLVTLASK